jgi:hypothetical protein
MPAPVTGGMRHGAGNGGADLSAERVPPASIASETQARPGAAGAAGWHLEPGTVPVPVPQGRAHGPVAAARGA